MQTIWATEKFDENFADFNEMLFAGIEHEEWLDYEDKQVLIRVEDDYGWDDLVDLGNGDVLFTDRNSGVHSLAKGVTNLEEFVEKFKSYF